MPSVVVSGRRTISPCTNQRANVFIGGLPGAALRGSRGRSCRARARGGAGRAVRCRGGGSRTMASRVFTARAGALVVLSLPACAQWRQRNAPPPPPVPSALHFAHGVPLVAVHGPADRTAWFVV